jgi:hypothetical protein
VFSAGNERNKINKRRNGEKQMKKTKSHQVLLLLQWQQEQDWKCWSEVACN